MNMLIVVLGITLTCAFVSSVLERHHFIHKTLDAMEKRVKDFYACEALIYYGIAFLKEQGALIKEKGTLRYEEMQPGVGILKATEGAVTIECVVKHDGQS